MTQPKDAVVHSSVFFKIRETTANLILHCGTIGSPKPLISWFTGDINITSQGIVLSNGTLGFNVTLGIHVIRRGLFYHCRATNMIGQQSATRATVRSRNANVTYACMFF